MENLYRWIFLNFLSVGTCFSPIPRIPNPTGVIHSELTSCFRYGKHFFLLEESLPYRSLSFLAVWSLVEVTFHRSSSALCNVVPPEAARCSHLPIVRPDEWRGARSCPELHSYRTRLLRSVQPCSEGPGLKNGVRVSWNVSRENSLIFMLK